MALTPSPYRTQNQVLLVKAESTPSADAAPTLGSNAVLVEAPTMDPTIETADNPEITGSFDQSPSYFTGAFAPGSTRFRLKGSLAAGVTPPDFTPLLNGCGMLSTNTSAAVTGTLTAAGANSATLAVGASSTDNFYKGMPLLVTGKKPRIIVAYNGTTKQATVSPKWAVTYGDGTTDTAPAGTEAYTIPPNTLFAPASASIPTMTWKRYLQNNNGGNARLETILGWRGSAAFTIARAGSTVDIRGQGDFVAPADVSWPGNPTFLNQVPPVMNNAIVALDDNIVRGMITLDLGITLETEEDPNAPFGRSGTAQTRRHATGTFRAPIDLVANRDVFGSLQAGTSHFITAVWGTVPGNRVTFMIPAAIYVGRTQTDVNGVLHDTLNIQTAGVNNACFLCMW